ncbi:hypothetical protein GM418_21560 [Maribellus comscasis]|uniref:SLATT domain-containing protein n=1 Tax=Maribellus comscasis TaxID=2681766 RepID=A0A6I6JYC3_9BACT|nr:hypothetical protein [Maribellus comscasis]QGY46158.1 hypothetical protein GM418_21560 [Maribellus comscasis]
MEQQIQIFKNLINYKYKYFILSLLATKYYKYDRNLNIFLAFATSGSVATWALWNKLPIIWAGIIVAAQIINLIKPYFPFSKICKEINDKQRLLQGLLLNYENLWSKIQFDEISEKKGREEYLKLRKQIQELLNFSDDIVFNVDKKIKSVAQEKTNSYLNRNYFHALA